MSQNSPLGAAPSGLPVGSYPTYVEAQRAVDHLSDNKFPVEDVMIVGSDLRLVENVLGRLSWGRAALAGASGGAWFGLLVGVLLALFAASNAVAVVVAGLAYGAVFGLVLGLVRYAGTGGRRDFVSRSEIQAGRYDVLCQARHAERARDLLAKLSLRG